MANSRRPWSEDEIAKLRSMAGRFPPMEIAIELGRSPGAVMVEASKLKISLSTRSITPRPDMMQ
jgi:hypothetical protein